jgi:group I intron endonuclease
MLHYIYRIFCSINDKIYIGQTYSLQKRWTQHKSDAKYQPILLVDRAIKKYGENNFIIDHLATCQSLLDANYIETQMIAQYDATNLEIGYNISKGGGNNAGLPAWNKGTKGVMKPNSGSFQPTIIWPENQELLDQVNQMGLTTVANQLGINVSTVSKHLIRHKLVHQRTRRGTTSFQRGSAHKSAKLAESQVLEIVRLSATHTYQELAQIFEVSRATISAILSGQRWNHLTQIK